MLSIKNNFWLISTILLDVVGLPFSKHDSYTKQAFILDFLSVFPVADNKRKWNLTWEVHSGELNWLQLRRWLETSCEEDQVRGKTHLEQDYIKFHPHLLVANYFITSSGVLAFSLKTINVCYECVKWWKEWFMLQRAWNQ